VRGVSLASADGQPMDVFTLLYTSGSSGTPKAVMVSAESFCNDVCERSFASPLVSVSFIPLSHSSDRMKLWEFMGNGGRIGFAHYAASNWASHERGGKKDALLGSLDGGLNDVLSLLHQVR
jgi:long-subunit acyl-CoA synthetase (AMP-forming)